MSDQNDSSAATAAEESAYDVAETMGLRWLREHASEDLSGKQQRAILTGLMHVIWKPLKLATFTDMADAVRTNPILPDELAEALEAGAAEQLRELTRGSR